MTNPQDALRVALEEDTEFLRQVGGCSDGGCIVHRPKGMHTNGGCKCSKDHIKMQRLGYAHLKLVEKVNAALSAQAAEQPTIETGEVMDDATINETTGGRRVLDPCCGSRMMWIDRAHPDVVFGDQRHETITVTDRSHGNADGTRTLRIEPDVQLDFRALPYADGTFKLVAFDPPHLVRAGPKSWLAAKYGKLSENWRADLRAGFAECFRVLATDGVLVFKWNETQVKVSEVLALTEVRPLFGHPSGRKGLTHWLVFMKPAAAKTGAAQSKG